MIELTDEVRDEILRDLRKTRAPARTAKNTGYPITLVLTVKNEDDHPRPFREELHGGWGRPELSKFFVARKRPWEAWENKTSDIAQARENYEEGTHEMATGRDGDWLILYSIPRRKVDPNRKSYFLPENLS